MDGSLVAAVFLHAVAQMKMFHWSTPSYAKHKAADFFVEEMTSLTDRFVETMMGHTGRIKARMPPPMMKWEGDAIKFLQVFSKFLETLPLDPLPGLVNIRDEMLAVTSQARYLLSLG